VETVAGWADPFNVGVGPTMPMGGMAPMIGSASVAPSEPPGRYRAYRPSEAGVASGLSSVAIGWMGSRERPRGPAHEEGCKRLGAYYVAVCD